MSYCFTIEDSILIKSLYVCIMFVNCYCKYITRKETENIKEKIDLSQLKIYALFK